MCVIVFQKAWASIAEKELKACWDNNPDGAGYMFSENETLIVRKPFFTFEDFMKSYAADFNRVISNFVIHFRITTSGKNNKVNTHPHRVGADVALVHNGVLSDLSFVNSGKSDTVLFCRKLAKLPKNFLSNSTSKFLLEAYAQENRSSFAFMDRKGEVTLLNEGSGHWESDVWFSNLYHRTTYKDTHYADVGKCPVCWGYSQDGEPCADCETWEADLKSGKGVYCATLGGMCKVVKCATCLLLHTPENGYCIGCGVYHADLQAGRCADCSALSDYDARVASYDNQEESCKFCDAELKTTLEIYNGLCARCVQIGNRA